MKIYEFKIENDYGVPTKPTKNVTIKAKIPSNIVKPKVYRVTDMAEMKTSLSGDTASFTTNTYGEFAFVSSDGPASQAKTGNISNNSSKGLAGVSNNKSRVNSGKKSADTRESDKSKASNDRPTPTSVSQLNNDSTDFTTSSQPAQTDQASQVDVGTKPVRSKENPKVIFYCVLILAAIIGGSAYVYIRFSKRLIYEFKYNSYLKNKMNEFNKVRNSL